MRFTLHDLGYPWKTIKRGRSNVGRVWQHVGTKQWHGMIGKDEATGSTMQEAFRNVAAKALGFETPGQVANHNAKVRHRNAVARQQANQAFNALMAGEFERFGDLMGFPPAKSKRR